MSKRNVEFRQWQQAQINAAAEWLSGQVSEVHGDPDGVMDFGRPELTADGIQMLVKAAGLRGSRSSLATCRVPVAWTMEVDDQTLILQAEIDAGDSLCFDVHVEGVPRDFSQLEPHHYGESGLPQVSPADFYAAFPDALNVAETLGQEFVAALESGEATVEDAWELAGRLGLEQATFEDAVQIYDDWMQFLIASQQGGAR